MNNKIMIIISMVVMFALMITLSGFSNIKVNVDCYDNNNHKIINIVCEKSIFIDESIDFIMRMLVIISMFSSLIFTVKHILD